MVSSNVDKVFREVVRLTLDERKQLMALLETEAAPSPEETAEAALLRKGIIISIPPPPTEADIARFRSYKPVKVDGKPVSESLIEDRR